MKNYETILLLMRLIPRSAPHAQWWDLGSTPQISSIYHYCGATSARFLSSYPSRFFAFLTPPSSSARPPLLLPRASKIDEMIAPVTRDRGCVKSESGTLRSPRPPSYTGAPWKGGWRPRRERWTEFNQLIDQEIVQKKGEEKGLEPRH